MKTIGLSDHDTDLLQRLEQSLAPLSIQEMSASRFDESHEAFESASDQQSQILGWLCDYFLANERSKAVDMLSIGCGSGILDGPLLQYWFEHSVLPQSYVGADPNPVACERFRNLFADCREISDRITVLEDTVETLAADGSYRYILAVHSLYYFADPVAAIQKLTAMLQPGGELVIFQAPRDELNLLAHCFWSSSHENIWYSRELRTHLLEAEYSFKQTRIDGHVDISDCVGNASDASASEHGKLLIDFITQVDCAQLPEDVIATTQSYLESVATERDDRTYVPHPVDVFVISAPTDASH
jgi:SAM-dependent methyltransferase